MQHFTRKTFSLSTCLALVTVTLITGCGGGGGGGYGGMGSPPPVTPPPPPTPSAFTMSKLVSNGSVTAATTDANLVNPWGLVFAPTAPAWIANNGSQTSTLYDGTGKTIPLVVALPAGLNGDADATGIVFNGTTDFLISANNVVLPAAFIFDGEGGTIIGWARGVDATHGLVMYDDGGGNAIYKGLALASNASGNLLYATDFHNNKVDVFDKTFHKTTVSGGFVDSTLPAGYAPFGIQALQVAGATMLYVTYAKQDADAEDDVQGAGLGMVNVFNTDGALQKHLVAVGGALNAPWGLALAPATTFGTVSGKLLVGNFGNGTINIYDPSTGAASGSVSDTNGQAIATEGLWAIAFGNGAVNQPTTTLYFTAGIGGESGGVYGRIDLGATAPDIVAPTATITAPTAGAALNGMASVTATATDDKAVTQVTFLIGGATVIGTATTAPYSVTWNTTTVANGAYVLTAQAKDAAGNVGTSAQVAVTVGN